MEQQQQQQQQPQNILYSAEKAFVNLIIEYPAVFIILPCISAFLIYNCIEMDVSGAILILMIIFFSVLDFMIPIGFIIDLITLLILRLDITDTGIVGKKLSPFEISFDEVISLSYVKNKILIVEIATGVGCKIKKKFRFVNAPAFCEKYNEIVSTMRAEKETAAKQSAEQHGGNTF